MAPSCTTKLLSRPILTAFFLSTALIFSLVSSLDCQFLTIQIGFTPSNVQFSSESTSVGLWTYESPVKAGYCVLYEKARESGGLVAGGDDASYARWFRNEDLSWTVSRFSALFSLVVGLVANVAIWVFLCSKSPAKQHSIIAIFTILAFLCETIKLSLFFQISYCTSDQIWLNSSSNKFQSAKSCSFNKGAGASLISILSYFFIVIAWLQEILKDCECCKRKHSDQDHLDDVSLPTFLKSIGESVASKKSKTFSRRGSGSRRFAVAGARSAVSGAESSSGEPRDHSDASTLTMTHALGKPGGGRFSGLPYGNPEPKIRDHTDASTLTWDA